MGVQASLPPELVPLGATTFLFIISASCAIFLAIGEAIFQDRLTKNLTHVVPSALVEQIVSVGATSIRSVVPTNDLPAVIAAYSKAVTQVFVRLPISLPRRAMGLTFLPFLVSSCRGAGPLFSDFGLDQVDLCQETGPEGGGVG